MFWSAILHGCQNHLDAGGIGPAIIAATIAGKDIVEAIESK